MLVMKDFLPKLLAMPDSAEVCGCNGVCKGTIVKAIKEQGIMFTLRRCAQTHQGFSLMWLVHWFGRANYHALPQAVIIQQSPQNQTAMCSCTDALAIKKYVNAIRQEKHLLTIAAVHHAIFSEWKTPHGCTSCRPALNYYLHFDLAETEAERRSTIALH